MPLPQSPGPHPRHPGHPCPLLDAMRGRLRAVIEAFGLFAAELSPDSYAHLRAAVREAQRELLPADEGGCR